MSHCLCVQLIAESQNEPDPYVTVQLGSQLLETTEKEACTRAIWERQFALLCDDPTPHELNISVSFDAVYNFFTLNISALVLNLLHTPA